MTCTDQKTVYAGNKKVIVPCGRCLPCLSNKRNDWTFRLQQEYKHSRSAVFLTLTYDRKHLPTDEQLDKRHVQLFLKRIRKQYGNTKIRYYAVGEYGTLGNRPHYHILLFNLESEDVRSAWPAGSIHVGTLTLASVAYCTKYIVQPVTTRYTVKPFALMSRAYGIGGSYLSDDMVQWHRSAFKNYTVTQSGKGRLPRFYRDKIFYRTLDRAHIAHQAKRLVLSNTYAEKQALIKLFGKDDWQNKKTEMQNAIISRISETVKHSQTL